MKQLWVLDDCLMLLLSLKIIDIGHMDLMDARLMAFRDLSLHLPVSTSSLPLPGTDTTSIAPVSHEQSYDRSLMEREGGVGVGCGVTELKGCSLTVAAAAWTTLYQKRPPAPFLQLYVT